MSDHDTTPKAPRAPQFFAVPAGTRSASCDGCQQTVFWIVTDAGRRMPVNCDVEGGIRPARFTVAGVHDPKAAGRGISHFVDCPKAGEFRRKR